MNCRGQSGNIAVYALNFNDFTSAARITAEVSRGRTFFDIDITTAHDSDGRPIRIDRIIQLSGSGGQRRGRPAGADPDDLNRDRPRPTAARSRHERARPRDRRADGARHRRRAPDLDGAQSLGAADARAALRAL